MAERAYLPDRSIQPARPSPAARPPLAVHGLGGAAIVSVLLYDARMVPTGVLGLELFLVVSGFLLTLPVLQAVARTGHAGVTEFCRRRLTYVVISLTAVLGSTLALVYLLGGLQEARRSGADALAALLQEANWHDLVGEHAPWQQLAWDSSGRINPLGHLWLVSLLEQLCLASVLFIALLSWVWRRSLAAVTVLVWITVGAAAAVAPLRYDGTNGDRLYLGTDSQAATFLAGVAAAGTVLVLQARRARADRDGRASRGRLGLAAALVSGTVAVAVLAFATWTAWRNVPWLYHGGLAVVAGAAALLVTALCYQRGPLFRRFSWGPLAELGRLSYPIYLIHLPVYWLLKTTKPQVAPYGLLVVGGGLSWLFAMFMHYGIAARLQGKRWQASRLVPIAAACALVVSAAHYLPAATEKRMKPPGRPVVLTLGDALADDLATALATRGSGRFGLADGGIPGCGVMPAEHCPDWERSWRTSVRESKPQIILVHLGVDAERRQVGGRSLSPCDRTYRSRYGAQLDRAARVWAEEAPRARVLLMNVRNVTATTDATAARCYNAVVARFAVAHAQVTLLDLDAFLCADRSCRQATPGRRAALLRPRSPQPIRHGVPRDLAGAGDRIGLIDAWPRSDGATAAARTARRRTTSHLAAAPPPRSRPPRRICPLGSEPMSPRCHRRH